MLASILAAFIDQQRQGDPLPQKQALTIESSYYQGLFRLH